VSPKYSWDLILTETHPHVKGCCTVVVLVL
jgi:hypothetical protein